MSNTNVVTNLNADLLDGYHAAQVLTANYSDTVDLNEISVPSIYSLSTENPNLPSGLFRYGNLLTVKESSADTAWQLIGSYGNDALWFRRGTWYANGTGTLRTNAWKAIAFTDSNVASSSKWATPRTITITGSVTGSVSIDGSQNVTLTTTTNHTHSYLPLTGGTVTGQLYLTGLAEGDSDVTDNTEILTSYASNNGFADSKGLVHRRDAIHLYNYVKSKLDSVYLPLSGGTMSNTNVVTNLNADFLDGRHAASFYQQKSLRSDQNSIYDLRFNYGTYDKGDYGGTYNGEYPTNYGTYLAITQTNKNSGALMFFDAPTNNALGHIYVRTRGAGDRNTTYSKWGTLAYLTDNVASATKLATSRTLWGQSFDGTGNVSGALTGVTDITASGKITAYNELHFSRGNWCYISAGSTGENGTLLFNTGGANRLIIKSNGNVGIGTTGPSYKLDVNGDIRANGTIFSHEGCHIDGTSGGTYGKLEIVDDVDILGENTNINFIESLNIKQHNTTNNTDTSIVSIDNSGNITLNVINNNGGSYEISTRLGSLGIGIPSDDPNLVNTPSFLMSNRGYIYINASLPSSPNYPLVVNGTIQCTTLSQTSDIKYKSNIKQIEYEEALKIIENLNPVTWD